MDEPFSALDSITRARVQNLAAELLAGRTVLMITHDPLEACRLGHELRLLAGAPATLGPPIVPTVQRRVRRMIPRFWPPRAPCCARSPPATPHERPAARRCNRRRADFRVVGLVLLTAAPSYLLPDPWAVAQALFARRAVLLDGTLTTVAEVAAGMALGTLLGAACGLAIVFSPSCSAG